MALELFQEVGAIIMIVIVFVLGYVFTKKWKFSSTETEDSESSK
jgi:hypothetical protein